jgi:polar amino acid transport system substrate-binding protein
MRTLVTRRLLALGTAIVALSAVAAACGDNGGSGSQGTENTSEPTPTADNELAGLVPDAIKSDGKIRVGTDASYAPNEFLDKDGKTVIGMDVDLFNAVAEKLGLEVEWVPSVFGDIIPGVQSGKYEAGVSSFTINAERMAQVQMVAYFNSPTQWATKKGNPAGIDIENACGKRIAVQRDTVQVTDLETRSKACTDAGKPKIVKEEFQGQDQATASVVTGKNEGMLADLPIAAYAVQQTGDQLELLADPYGDAPYGVAVKADDKAFAEAIQKAFQATVEDGSYGETLKKWGSDKGGLTADEMQINPTVS